MVDDGLTSSFNQAGYQIIRLHGLWESANKASRGGRLEEWRWVLGTIWRELSPDALRLGGTSFEDREKNKFYVELGRIDKHIEDAVLVMGVKETERIGRRAFFMALVTKEEFLRNLEELSGKGAKLEDKNRDLEMV